MILSVEPFKQWEKYGEHAWKLSLLDTGFAVAGLTMGRDFHVREVPSHLRKNLASALGGSVPSLVPMFAIEGGSSDKFMKNKAEVSILKSSKLLVPLEGAGNSQEENYSNYLAPRIFESIEQSVPIIDSLRILSEACLKRKSYIKSTSPLIEASDLNDILRGVLDRIKLGPVEVYTTGFNHDFDEVLLSKWAPEISQWKTIARTTHIFNNNHYQAFLPGRQWPPRDSWGIGVWISFKDGATMDPGSLISGGVVGQVVVNEMFRRGLESRPINGFEEFVVPEFREAMDPVLHIGVNEME